MIRFTTDMTSRWACRAGDFIMWARFQDGYTLADVWELRDGDLVTLTNRAADLPAWFDLHPLEAAGRSLGWMQQKLAEGYNPPRPMDGPNLWRVFAGDRLA